MEILGRVVSTDDHDQAARIGRRLVLQIPNGNFQLTNRIRTGGPQPFPFCVLASNLWYQRHWVRAHGGRDQWHKPSSLIDAEAVTKPRSCRLQQRVVLGRE